MLCRVSTTKLSNKMPFRIPFLFKFAAVKNAVSFTLINPVSKQIKRIGGKYQPFHTSCKTLTGAYYQARSKIAPSYQIPKLTKEVELNMGSRIIAWGLISTAVITGTYLFSKLFRNNDKKKEAKTQKLSASSTKNATPLTTPTKGSKTIGTNIMGNSLNPNGFSYDHNHDKFKIPK